MIQRKKRPSISELYLHLLWMHVLLSQPKKKQKNAPEPDVDPRIRFMHLFLLCQKNKNAILFHYW